MNQLTEAMMRAVCARIDRNSTPLQSYLDAFSSDEATRLLEEWEINTPARLAAFMANVCHETGGFTVIRENMNYRTAARVVAVWPKRPEAVRFVGNPVGMANFQYGFRLGNEDDGTNDNDGFDYRGGGPLQATGKGFYRYLERKTGLPFVAHPDLIERPENWVLVACVTWRAHQSAGDLNVFADHGNFKGCCLGINYGNGYAKATPIGWKDRQLWHAVWIHALDAQQTAPAAPSLTPVTYRVGMPYSEAVKQAQRRLNALGYAEKGLAEDGLYGPRMRSAVLDFEAENGLPLTGEMSPAVFTALMADAAKHWPVPAEAVAGISGLRKAGDAEVKSADADKAAAALLATGSAATAVQQTGALDLLMQTGKDADTLTHAVNSLVGIVKLGLGVVLPAALAFAAFLLWRRYGAQLRARIERWSRPVGGSA